MQNNKSIKKINDTAQYKIEFKLKIFNKTQRFKEFLGRSNAN